MYYHNKATTYKLRLTSYIILPIGLWTQLSIINIKNNNIMIIILFINVKYNSRSTYIYSV